MRVQDPRWIWTRRTPRQGKETEEETEVGEDLHCVERGVSTRVVEMKLGKISVEGDVKRVTRKQGFDVNRFSNGENNEWDI